MHINVLACTMFAAVCGSSAATTATVGKITLSELHSRGYPPSLAIGSLAGAGTLGFLIPPSLILIIYGVLSETSILRLFIAGAVPGLLLAGCYMLVIAVLSLRTPLPDDVSADPTDELRSPLASLRKIGPVLLLIFVILGSMYGGYASPTEAAVIGVFGALAISVYQRCLTIASLWEALVAAARTSCMVGLLLAGGSLLSIAMGYLGIPQAVASPSYS
jgi:C4-dicarboxylate transporter, DctM subunit